MDAEIPAGAPVGTVEVEVICAGGWTRSVSATPSARRTAMPWLLMVAWGLLNQGQRQGAGLVRGRAASFRFRIVDRPRLRYTWLYLMTIRTPYKATIL